MGAVLIWTAAATCLMSVGCSREIIATTIDTHTCPEVVMRYKIIVILDAVIELILVIIPIYFCWRILTSLPIKMQVLGVFAFRAIVAIIALVYIRIWETSLHGRKPGVDCTNPIVLQQCQLIISTMAGTIPCLKNFLRTFTTGSGVSVLVDSSKRRSPNTTRNTPGSASN
jgi:hypothetical protein